jgi:hypothetical protein
MFDGMGPPCSPREVLGPDPLSVLCLTQFLKHKHAVQTAYCGDPTVASMCPLEQLKTHVDCRNAKSYVHFRWYSNSIIDELKQQLVSPSASNQVLAAIGCVNIQHWNKKQPKSSDSLPHSSKELVELDLEIDKVVSTFQVVHPEQDTIQLETMRRPDRSRILTWKGVDDLIWDTAAKLGLLPHDVIKQQRTVPFPIELARSDNSWSSCSCKSDRVIASKISPVVAPVSKSKHSFVRVSALPIYMRPAYDAMQVWARKSVQVCEYHMSQTAASESQESIQGSLSLMLPDLQCTLRASPENPSQRSSTDLSTSRSFESSDSFEINSSSCALSFQYFHASIDSGANAPDLEIENVFSTWLLAPAESCQVIGLFLSIGSHSGDETVLVTHCINSISTVLQNVFRPPRSHSLPRVFVALRVQGTFSLRDCDARFVFYFLNLNQCQFPDCISSMISFHSTLQARHFEKSSFFCFVIFQLTYLRQVIYMHIF